MSFFFPTEVSLATAKPVCLSHNAFLTNLNV